MLVKVIKKGNYFVIDSLDYINMEGNSETVLSIIDQLADLPYYTRMEYKDKEIMKLPIDNL